MTNPVAKPADTRAQSDPRLRALIADDQKDIVRALRLLLRGEGFEVATAHAPQSVLQALEEQSFDVVLIDLNYARDTTSGREGLDLLRDIRIRDRRVPVVVMTAWGSVELAVEALQHGAADFIEKPWKNQRLVSILRTQAALGAALREQDRLRAHRRQRDADEFAPIVVESPEMRAVMSVLERVADADVNVLITGDNGTGKSLLAHHLHRLSARRDGPFVAVNVGALASGVFESELFGHVKGAFTDARKERTGRFELADGGTLLLDEIGNLPLEQQARLLHVLESGRFEPVGSSRSREVNVRLVAATNADLRAAVANGTFRKDLFFRLNTVEVEVPALAGRVGDIAALAERFLAREAEKYGRAGLEFSGDALRALLAYDWPGNVRELAHAVERAALLAPGEHIEAVDLALVPSAPGSAPNMPLTTLAEMECHLIEMALQRCQGNVIEAAGILGISRSALYRRLEKYGLQDAQTQT